MLYPCKLRENEYICLFMMQTDDKGKIKINENGREIKFHKFVKGFEQYEEMIKKYKHNYHIYNALATVKPDKEGNLKRTKANMRQRRTLFFDFDKKDYPNLRDAYDFTRLIKDKLPDLFLHAYYDSGHGIHYYVIVPPTCDVEMLSDLNKDISALVGADTQACQVTQVARIPCTFNLKRPNEDGKYPMVREIDHYIKHPYEVKNFHPCNIAYIKRRVENAKKLEALVLEEKSLEEWDYKGSSINDHRYPCLCTEKMLREGADEHQRNTWLGRIISMLLREEYCESKIREMCLDWNTRCRPPKALNTVSSEINRYLEMKDIYNLNGCWDKIPNPRVSDFVRKQCDKFHCMQAIQKKTITIQEDVGVKMAQKLLNKNNLRKDGKNEFSGFEYLIISILYKYIKPYSRTPFTVKDLKSKMQYKKNGRWQLCMDIQNFKNTLESLKEHECIELSLPTPEQCNKKTPSFEDNIIVMKRRLREFGDKYIEFYFSAARAFICKQITANEFKVFLCIVNNMRNGKSCTIEDLDEILHIGTSHVMRAITNLKNAQCIDVVQYRSEKGNLYNLYSHKNTDIWNDFTINDNGDVRVDLLSSDDKSLESKFINEENMDVEDGIIIRLLA